METPSQLSLAPNCNHRFQPVVLLLHVGIQILPLGTSLDILPDPAESSTQNSSTQCGQTQVGFKT